MQPLQGIFILGTLNFIIKNTNVCEERMKKVADSESAHTMDKNSDMIDDLQKSLALHSATDS